MSDNYERDMALSLVEAIFIINDLTEEKLEMSNGHEKTEQFIIENELSLREIAATIKSISADDYIKGPIPDDKENWRRKKPVWIFKKTYEGLTLYIKLKIFINNKHVYVVSMHEDE